MPFVIEATVMGSLCTKIHIKVVLDKYIFLIGFYFWPKSVTSGSLIINYVMCTWSPDQIAYKSSVLTYVYLG